LQARRTEDAQGCLEQLQVIETGCGPEVESAALRDLLTRSAGLRDSLADPIEAHTYPNPFAGANAYKHRLHALRCEYVQTRVRALELEEQLAHARLLIASLESRVTLLEQMKSSFVGKVIVRGFRYWWAVCQRLRRLGSAAANS
jgi:hypothetical protein